MTLYVAGELDDAAWLHRVGSAPASYHDWLDITLNLYHGTTQTTWWLPVLIYNHFLDWWVSKSVF